MSFDIASILVAMTLSMVTLAFALFAVMDGANRAARFAQISAGLQACGWSLLLASESVTPRSTSDVILSTLSMACISGSFAYSAAAFELWAGHKVIYKTPAVLGIFLTVGYAVGFADYAFRVGWANGLLALQMAFIIVTLLKEQRAAMARWRWLPIVGLTVQSVITACRAILGAFRSEDFPAFLTPHPVNVAFAFAGNCTAELLMIGMLLAYREEAAQALERLATTDGLTGALNRRAWLALANAKLANTAVEGQPVSVLIMDIDHFKQINDTLGHDAGDRALQLFARLMQEASASGDLVCRYGGEEFCVLMAGEQNGVINFDQRMRAMLASTVFEVLGHQVTYSAGLVTRNSADRQISELLLRADQALYHAKATGRNRTIDAVNVRSLTEVAT
ncbi:MAG: GGDEF domain-containing protein [Pseudomonadota bacterium]|nr:GGDEF domain-containing protein [Pseudomonadota bacterium]